MLSGSDYPLILPMLDFEVSKFADTRSRLSVATQLRHILLPLIMQNHLPPPHTLPLSSPPHPSHNVTVSPPLIPKSQHHHHHHPHPLSMLCCLFLPPSLKVCKHPKHFSLHPHPHPLDITSSTFVNNTTVSK
jgi:hypothetical protein